MSVKQTSKPNPAYPVIISFYAGGNYYVKAAARLQKDCQKLGLDYEIIKAPLKEPVSWIEACRYKVRFIDKCLRKYKRPVLWMDVDTRLLRKPELFADSQVDLGFFMRGISKFKNYDPGKWTRLMSPAILYFGYTPLTKEFVSLMKTLEAKHRGQATDDYFLQETWINFEKPLSLLVPSPELVSFDLKAKGQAYFYIGLSGHQKPNKALVEQHLAEPYSGLRRRSAFMHEAARLNALGRHGEALFMMRRAFVADPTSEELAYNIARQLRERGQVKAALGVLDKIESRGDPVDHAQRFLADTEMLDGNLERGEAIIRKLISRGNRADADWGRSRLIRIELAKRARALNLEAHERPPLWWMEAPYPGNFGDMLNPYIIEKLSGKPPLFSPRERAILAIGSTIKFATANSHVWGAGTPRMSDRLNAEAHYHAVRGPLTRKLVQQSGGKCPEVYGDPAWFLPQLYQPKRSKQRYKLGLIKHHVNEDDIRTGKGVKDISVIRAGYEGIEKFIDEVNSCQAILTTSLHGLIVSHAYGIPARWCEVTDATQAIAGDGTKHHDYMLSVGIKPEPPLKLKRGTLITLAFRKEANRLPAQQIDLEALANAAPFEITARWGKSAPVEKRGQPLQTADWHGQVASVPGPPPGNRLKHFVKTVDSRLLNDSLRRVYVRLKG